MTLSQRHPAALAFRRRLKTDLGSLRHGVTWRAGAQDGFGLVIQIDSLPAKAFDASRTGPTPDMTGPLLSPYGRHLWDGLHALALEIVADHMAPDDVAALILQPSAIERARRGLQLARAA